MHFETPTTGLFRGPRGQIEGLWLLGKLSGPCWPCPLCGSAPGSIPRAQSQDRRAGAKGSHPPLSSCWGRQRKGLSQRHPRGRLLLAVSEPPGLESQPQRKGGREGRQRGYGESRLGTQDCPGPLVCPCCALQPLCQKGCSSHLTGKADEAWKAMRLR